MPKKPAPIVSIHLPLPIAIHAHAAIQAAYRNSYILCKSSVMPLKYAHIAFYQAILRSDLTQFFNRLAPKKIKKPLKKSPK